MGLAHSRAREGGGDCFYIGSLFSGWMGWDSPQLSEAQNVQPGKGEGLLLRNSDVLPSSSMPRRTDGRKEGKGGKKRKGEKGRKRKERKEREGAKEKEGKGRSGTYYMWAVASIDQHLIVSVCLAFHFFGSVCSSRLAPGTRRAGLKKLLP